MALLAACGEAPARSEKDSAQPAAVPSANAQSEDAGAASTSEPQALRCVPDSFGPGDTLTLTMNVPHGPFLAVVAPGDTWFYLIHAFRAGSTFNPSMVPPASFQSMSSFSIPADLRARPNVYGRDSLEPVFHRPGDYRIVLAEKLSTDFGPPPVECMITYRGR